MFAATSSLAIIIITLTVAARTVAIQTLRVADAEAVMLVSLRAVARVDRVGAGVTVAFAVISVTIAPIIRSNALGLLGGETALEVSFVQLAPHRATEHLHLLLRVEMGKLALPRKRLAKSIDQLDRCVLATL